MFDITCCKTQPFPSSRSDKNVDTDLKSAVWATWRKKKKTPQKHAVNSSFMTPTAETSEETVINPALDF